MLSKLVVLLALAGGGYWAWREGHLNDILPPEFPRPQIAIEDEPETAVEELHPISGQPTGVVLTKEENLLKEHWIEVSAWSAANFELTAAIMHTESRGNPKAVSTAGALGLMQVMPATGKDAYNRLGFTKYKPTRENMLTPAVSIYFGTHYLQWLHSERTKRGQSLEWFIRSYNAGAGGADKYIVGGKNKENDNYVAFVMKQYKKLLTRNSVTA